MSAANETRFIIQHESCECKSGLYQSACDSKQKWNHNECQCEYKEIDNLDFCESDYMWKPSTYDCGCNKACKTDECLYIKYFSCERRLISKLVMECENEILNAIQHRSKHLLSFSLQQY